MKISIILSAFCFVFLPLCVKAGEVPASLQTIEGTAEDVVDQLLLDLKGKVGAKQWTKVTADLNEVEKAWSKFQLQNQQNNNPGVTEKMVGAMSKAIADLKAEIAVKDDPGLAEQSANDIGYAAADLYEAYDPKIPADINRLDVSQTQILLDLKKNKAAVEGDLLQTHQAWDRVKASVLASGGKDVAAKFEKTCLPRTRLSKRGLLASCSSW